MYLILKKMKMKMKLEKKKKKKEKRKLEILKIRKKKIATVPKIRYFRKNRRIPLMKILFPKKEMIFPKMEIIPRKLKRWFIKRNSMLILRSRERKFFRTSTTLMPLVSFPFYNLNFSFVSFLYHFVFQEPQCLLRTLLWEL